MEQTRTSAADTLSDFADALKAGDTVQLTALIQQADGQLPRGPRNETLLHSATSYLRAENRLALMTVLLDAGLKVDAPDYHGRTPLHTASRETIDLLLAAGADVHARDKAGCIPPHTSMLSDPRLLADGVDARNRFGLTPLHHAALQPNDAQVAWLLANGADPAAQSTAAFRINEDRSDAFKEPLHEFAVGTRPYDMARFRHDQTKWSSGNYLRVMETLDQVTPWRGWFFR